MIACRATSSCNWSPHCAWNTTHCRRPIGTWPSAWPRSSSWLQSRERNRLARELHDTLAHSLTGLSVQLQAVETLMTLSTHRLPPAQLKEAQATVRSGIRSSRRAIQALRASPLEDLGLSEALRQLCRRQAERMYIPMDCAIADARGARSADRAGGLSCGRGGPGQRGAACRRHAGPGEPGPLAAERQASPGNPGQRHGLRSGGLCAADRFGLTGMAEWAELAGADLQIETTPGQGTLGCAGDQRMTTFRVLDRRRPGHRAPRVGGDPAASTGHRGGRLCRRWAGSLGAGGPARGPMSS